MGMGCALGPVGSKELVTWTFIVTSIASMGAKGVVWFGFLGYLLGIWYGQVIVWHV
jgi:hypothetical protein